MRFFIVSGRQNVACMTPAENQPRKDEEHEDSLSAQAYQTTSVALYEFLAPLVRNLDAGAWHWFRKLHIHRVSTLRKPSLMPYRNGALPLCAKTSSSKMTVAEPAFGGREVVSILRRQMDKELR